MIESRLLQHNGTRDLIVRHRTYAYEKIYSSAKCDTRDGFHNRVLQSKQSKKFFWLGKDILRSCLGFEKQNWRGLAKILQAYFEHQLSQIGREYVVA
jgi:hypothetical protein